MRLISAGIINMHPSLGWGHYASMSVVSLSVSVQF